MDFLPGTCFFLKQLSKHILEITNLHKACANRKIDCYEDQQEYQDVGIQEVIESARN